MFLQFMERIEELQTEVSDKFQFMETEVSELRKIVAKLDQHSAPGLTT